MKTMKKIFTNAISKMQRKATELFIRATNVLASTSGEITTDSLGNWVVGIVVVGAVVAAVKLAFPGLFANLIATLETKLDALW